MRAAAVAAFAVLAFAAPAQAAIAPPPTVLDFESASGTALDSAFYSAVGATLDSTCFDGGESAAAPLECASVVTPGHDSLKALQLGSGAVLDVRFASKQANV